MFGKGQLPFGFISSTERQQSLPGQRVPAIRAIGQ